MASSGARRGSGVGESSDSGRRGRLARDGLRKAARLTFADVQCEPPPGMTRKDFLLETQYLAGLPDRLDPDDEATAERVRLALAGHPWVRNVTQVRVTAGGV